MESTEGFKFKYLPEKDFERIVLKVQQARQEKEDDWNWQCYLAEINKTSSASNEKSSVSSASGDESNSGSNDEDTPSESEKITGPSHPPLAKTKRPKKSINTFNQHLKTCEAISKVQHSIQNLLAGIGIQLETAREEQLEGDDDEPTSAKAAKIRQTRIVEFNARFRRNYIYALQIEVGRTSEQQASLVSSGSAAPCNSTRQSALRALEQAHTRAFQALQVFQRQCQVLWELLSSHRLLEDLLGQLARLAELSSALGLPHEGLDSQRRSLREKLARHILQEDIARLGLDTPRLTPKKPQQTQQRQQQRLGPSKPRTTLSQTKSNVASKPSHGGISLRPSSQVQPPRSRKKADKRGRVRTTTWTRSEQESSPDKPALDPSHASCTPATSSSTSSQQPQDAIQPVNVRVYVMQHKPAAPLCSALTEVQEAGTQTTCLESRGVGTDAAPQPTHEEQEDPGPVLGNPLAQTQEPALNSTGDAPVAMQQPDNDSLSARLQRAVLSELAGETNHLDPLIEQLMREEFL